MEALVLVSVISLVTIGASLYANRKPRTMTLIRDPMEEARRHLQAARESLDAAEHLLWR